jgi:hypothetical protein
MYVYELKGVVYSALTSSSFDELYLCDQCGRNRLRLTFKANLQRRFTYISLGVFESFS